MHFGQNDEKKGHFKINWPSSMYVRTKYLVSTKHYTENEIKATLIRSFDQSIDILIDNKENTFLV